MCLGDGSDKANEHESAIENASESDKPTDESDRGSDMHEREWYRYYLVEKIVVGAASSMVYPLRSTRHDGTRLAQCQWAHVTIATKTRYTSRCKRAISPWGDAISPRRSHFSSDLDLFSHTRILHVVVVLVRSRVHGTW